MCLWWSRVRSSISQISTCFCLIQCFSRRSGRSRVFWATTHTHTHTHTLSLYLSQSSWLYDLIHFNLVFSHSLLCFSHLSWLGHRKSPSRLRSRQTRNSRIVCMCDQSSICTLVFEIHSHLHVHILTSMCVCVCVCVCINEHPTCGHLGCRCCWCSLNVPDSTPFVHVIRFACQEFKVPANTSAILTKGIEFSVCVVVCAVCTCVCVAWLFVCVRMWRCLLGCMRMLVTTTLSLSLISLSCFHIYSFSALHPEGVGVNPNQTAGTSQFSRLLFHWFP
jgi:Ubiquitin fold modifier 1 protein